MRIQRLRACLPALTMALTLTATATQAGPIRQWLADRHAVTDLEDQTSQDDAPSSSSDLPSGTRVIRDLPYGPDQRQRMDIYLPRQPRNAPVLLMVHGGGWAIGDKQHGKVVRNKVMHWLPQGVMVVSVNYRMLPDASPTEQAMDVARALAEAQKRAPSWGGDSQRFVLMGHSAGAHLVALLSASPGLASARGASPWLGSVLLDSAALDVAKIMQTPRHYRLYDKAFGQDPVYWAKASPLRQLVAGALPMLAVCSSRRQGSCDQARSFADSAAELGVNVSVLPQDLNHGDINEQLGVPGAYTDAVDRFISTLPGFKRAASP
jgi:arylformamidase